MAGNSGLPDISIEIGVTIGTAGLVMDTVFPIPAPDSALFPGLDTGNIETPKFVDFADPVVVPPVQFYVVGDGLDNTVGNYWFSSDSFPLVDSILWTKMYLHQDGSFNESSPATDEGFGIYVHDPDDPILTTGGANMIVRTPQDDRNSQGPMNLADPLFAPYTMDRQGVISFTGTSITEANGYPGDSMCIIGFPVATLYAKSNPGGVMNGPTDTDFFIRILDVYPDGREFFVVEGCVNARARNYARGLVTGKDDDINYHKGFPEDEISDGIDDIPYSNINVGQVYEYKFKMMPIAYTWGKNHKIKILISSSNYTRYQVNPNLPINDGDFFRRKPGDGQKYTFNGVEMSPRVAVQRIAFSTSYPTNIDMPVYSPGTINTGLTVSPGINTKIDALVFPNPATDIISVYMNKDGRYDIRLSNMLGQTLFTGKFANETILSVNDLNKGLYFIKIRELDGNTVIVKKISVL